MFNLYDLRNVEQKIKIVCSAMSNLKSSTWHLAKNQYIFTDFPFKKKILKKVLGAITHASSENNSESYFDLNLVIESSLDS